MLCPLINLYFFVLLNSRPKSAHYSQIKDWTQQMYNFDSLVRPQLRKVKEDRVATGNLPAWCEALVDEYALKLGDYMTCVGKNAHPQDFRVCKNCNRLYQIAREAFEVRYHTFYEVFYGIFCSF